MGLSCGTRPRAFTAAAHIAIAAALLTAPTLGPPGSGELRAQAVDPAPAPETVVWATRSTTAAIELEEAGSASVRIDYVFVASPSGSPLPVSESIVVNLLGFGDATAREALVDGAPLVLWPTSGSRREAAFRPDSNASGRSLAVSIEYDIELAGDVDDTAFDVRVPLVTGPAPLGDRVDFDVTVRVPSGWTVGDGFPSGLRETSAGVWEASLPTVPSVVRVRGRADGARSLGWPLVVDLVTLVLLVGFASVGWRHLRGVVREARA